MRSDHIGQRLNSLDPDKVANRQIRLPHVGSLRGVQHSQIPRVSQTQIKSTNNHVLTEVSGEENKVHYKYGLASQKLKSNFKIRVAHSSGEKKMTSESTPAVNTSIAIVTSTVDAPPHTADNASMPETHDNEIVQHVGRGHGPCISADQSVGKQDMDSSHAEGSTADAQQLVNVEQGTINTKETNTKDNGHKISPLDKDLPSKPSLRSQESPEHRGVFDATDSAIKLLNELHPALAPKRSGRHLAPPRAINERRSASAGTVSHNGSPMARKYQSTPQIMEGYSPRSSFPPVKPVVGDFSPRASYPQSKQVMDGYSPRSRVGVGPTVRIASDADEIIMGARFGKARDQQMRSVAPGAHRLSQIAPISSVHPPRTSSLPNSPEVARIDSMAHSPSVVDRLSRPTKSSARRAVDSKTSILERGNRLGKNDIGTTPRSTKDRSKLPKSGTSATLRKTSRNIRSAVSALISGRRRTEDLQKLATLDGSFADSPAREEKELGKSNLIVHRPTHSAARGVTFAELPEKSAKQGNRRSLPGRVSRNKSIHKKNTSASSVTTGAHDWKGNPNDKIASDNGHQARDEAASFMSQAHRETNAGRIRPNNSQRLGFGRQAGDDEDPNTPPSSREGLVGHYAEDNGLLRDRFNESLPGVTAFLDEGLRGAEDGLFRVVEMIDQVRDPIMRATMLTVVGALETSIAATREARMANIVLHENVAALVNLTAQVAARAAAEGTTAAGQ